MKKNRIMKDMKVVENNSTFGVAEFEFTPKEKARLRRLCRGEEICIENMYPFIFKWDIDYDKKLDSLELNLPYIDFSYLYKNNNDPEMRNYLMEKRMVSECIKDLGDDLEVIDYDFDSPYIDAFTDFYNEIKEHVFQTHRKHFPIGEDREDIIRERAYRKQLLKEIEEELDAESYLRLTSDPYLYKSLPELLEKCQEEVKKAIEESEATIDIDPLTGKVSKNRLEMKKKFLYQNDNVDHSKVPSKFSGYENKLGTAITCHPNEMNNIEVNFKDNDIIEIKDNSYELSDDLFNAACDDIFNAACDGYRQAAIELSKNNKDRLDLLNACLYSMGITPGIVDINKLIKIDILHRRNNPMDDSRKIITYLIEYDLENCSLNNIF